MNCAHAQSVLAVLPPNFVELEFPEFSDELAHMHACSECLQFRTQVEQSDRELGTVLRKVTVPNGLKSRLMAQLALLNDTSKPVADVSSTSTSLPDLLTGGSNRLSDRVPEMAVAELSSVDTSGGAAAASAAQTVKSVLAVSEPLNSRSHCSHNQGSSPAPADRITRRKVLTSLGTAAALLVGLGVFLFVRQPEKQDINLMDLLAMSQDVSEANSAPFQKSFSVHLPTTALPFTRDLDLGQAHALRTGPAASGREIGAVFAFPAPGTQAVTAFLVVVDLRHVVVPDLPDAVEGFSALETYYPLPHKYPTWVWREGDQLMICFAGTIDPRVMDRLKPRYFDS